MEQFTRQRAKLNQIAVVRLRPYDDLCGPLQSLKLIKRVFFVLFLLMVAFCSALHPSSLYHQRAADGENFCRGNNLQQITPIYDS